MFVRLLKHFNGHKPGRILDMSEGSANALLRRPGKFAEPARQSARPSKSDRPKPTR